MVVQSIPLVLDLRNQNRNLSTVFLATGLVTEGDNAGGIYLWEASNTTPDDGFYSIQVTGVAVGRWIRIGAASNIYTSDGTLLSNRTVTLGGYTLTFAGSTFSSTYNADGTVTLGSLSGTGTRYVVAGPSGLLGAAGTIPTPGTPTRFIETFTASAGQTTFNTANTLYTYFFDVYVNGVLLDPTSFTATANQIVLADPCTNNDILEVIGFYNITYVATIPPQVGNAGKFLSTDGTNLLWTLNPLGTVTSVDMSVPTGFTISGNPVTTSGTLAVGFAAGYSLPTTVKQSNWDDAYTFVSNFPSQTGNNGKYLTTNGSILSWSTVDALPSQAGNAGKYLTTDGVNASWAVLNLAAYVPTSRTLTINGATYDLSANRTWSVGTVTSVELSAGTGISLSGTNPITSSGTITVTNTAPDQIVTITAGDNISVSGTYPNFTVSAVGETISSFLLMGA
jgi:hypothetical protein